MSDLISRQDAIDAICTWDKFGVDERGRVVRWYEGLEPYVHLRDVVWAIEKMPSAGADMSSFCDRLWKKAYDRGRAEAQLEIKERIDPERLVQMIRHSSQYNQPCPEWVYDVIRHS